MLPYFGSKNVDITGGCVPLVNRSTTAGKHVSVRVCTCSTRVRARSTTAKNNHRFHALFILRTVGDRLRGFPLEAKRWIVVTHTVWSRLVA